jgi:ethanolamine utilization microcompartment shell protein EutS
MKNIEIKQEIVNGKIVELAHLLEDERVIRVSGF